VLPALLHPGSSQTIMLMNYCREISVPIWRFEAAPGPPPRDAVYALITLRPPLAGTVLSSLVVGVSPPRPYNSLFTPLSSPPAERLVELRLINGIIVRARVPVLLPRASGQGEGVEAVVCSAFGAALGGSRCWPFGEREEPGKRRCTVYARRAMHNSDTQRGVY